MPGFIDDMMDKVDRAFEKHGVRPELDTLLEGRPRRNYEKRTHEQLLGDVNQLYDKLVILTRERDELRSKLGKHDARLESLKNRFWVVSGVVVAEAAVIGFLANQLFSRLH